MDTNKFMQNLVTLQAFLNGANNEEQIKENVGKKSFVVHADLIQDKSNGLNRFNK